MIDFQNGTFVKLSPSDPQEIMGEIGPMLTAQERVFLTFKGIRDWAIFTDKRLVVLNVQGLTGKKRDFTSLPYSKVQAFSVETAGTFDLDAELDLWFSGLGKVRLEFKGGVDIRAIGRLIGDHVL